MTNEVLTIEDVEEIERVPLEERLPGSTGYEALLAMVAKYPDHVAITALQAGAPLEPARDVTYSQLLDQVNRTANMLRSRGLKADESVTHLLPLIPEAFYLTIAAETVGIVNPVNPMLEREHIDSIVRSANTRVLVVPGKAVNRQVYEKACRVAAENQDIHTIYVLGAVDECDGVRFLPLEASIAEQSGVEIEGATAGSLDDTVAYYHTGGTTGAPKLARHSQRMRVGQTVSTKISMGFSESDCVVLGLPPFHVAGAIILGLIPLFCGSRLLLLSPDGYRDTVAVSAFWKVIEKHKVSVLVGVPTVFSGLLNVPIEGADLSSLRLVVTGGAAVPPNLLKTASEHIGKDVLQGFGMTEIGGMGLLQTAFNEESCGSAGIRGPYVEVKIGLQDADGRVRGEAAVDEIGVLCFRGPCVMSGYVGDIAHDELFTEDGWLDTGDLARMDARGEVWVMGRAKDLIIRSGHNIDPAVIEDALQGHDAVEVVAAVGKPDEYAGELPIAYVQLKPGRIVGADELADFARSRISERAAAPTEVILIDEIPKTGIDKVFKPALRIDAIRRTYEMQIAANPDIEVDVSVSVDKHPSFGLLATVLMHGDKSDRQQELVKATLAHFNTRVAVQWADKPRNEPA